MKKTILTLLCSLFIITGCEQEQQQTQQQPATVEVTPKEEKLVFEEEVWQDPVSYDEPRIQFIWRKSPSGPNVEDEIWSAKIDFSDLKIRVPAKLIKGLLRESKPSPNGRYVALAVDGERYEKQIYDLKTKQLTTISHGPVIPSFEWTQDSQTLYFNEGGKMKKYHIPSKKLDIVTKYKEHGNSYILMDNDTKFVFTRSDKIIIRDVATGNKIFEKKYYNVSYKGLIKYKDGKIFGYKTSRNGFVVVNINDPEKYIYGTNELSVPPRAFSPASAKKAFYHFSLHADLKTNKPIDINIKSKLYKLKGSKSKHEFYNIK